MEVVLGVRVILAWIAVVIWGTANLAIRAKRRNDWGEVGIAALSATTVAGLLLFLMPDQVFFGIHTLGFGAALALISGFVIFAVTFLS
jgi:hypothetical protein